MRLKLPHVKLPRVLQEMRDDLKAASERDPAAGNSLEVALFYPGLHAVWGYRISHGLWKKGWRFPARALQSTVRMFTGVDIHPAATIGQRLFIDHAMGVVVGETAEVGDDVLIFHGVTLGGVTMERGKRHPTVGDRVILGAGAKILGPVQIGSDAKVGANAVVVHDVPDKGVAVGVPSHLVGKEGGRGTSTHGVLPARLPANSREACTSLPCQEDHAHVSATFIQFQATYVHEDGVVVEPARHL